MKYYIDPVELKRLEIAERKAERTSLESSKEAEETEPVKLTNFQKKLIEKEKHAEKCARDLELRKRTEEQKRLDRERRQKERELKRLEREKNKKPRGRPPVKPDKILGYCTLCDSPIYKRGLKFCNRTCSGRYRQKINNVPGKIKARGEARKRKEKPKVYRNCLNCRKSFLVKNQHPSQVYCSRTCSNNVHNASNFFPRKNP